MTLWLVLLAIAPGIAIAVFVYFQDKYEPEHRLPLLLCFGLGALATLPIMAMERYLLFLSGDIFHSWLRLFAFSFFVIGLIEEAGKFAILYWFPFRRPFFNEPLDGIVYAVMIGMGYACVENLWYAQEYGFRVTLLRMFTAVPAHAVFSVIMGYYLGLARFPKLGTNTRNAVLRSILWPATAHGLYDFFLLQEIARELEYVALFLLIVGFTVSFDMIKKHQDDSPFRSN